MGMCRVLPAEAKEEGFQSKRAQLLAYLSSDASVGHEALHWNLIELNVVDS